MRELLLWRHPLCGKRSSFQGPRLMPFINTVFNLEGENVVLGSVLIAQVGTAGASMPAADGERDDGECVCTWLWQCRECQPVFETVARGWPESELHGFVLDNTDSQHLSCSDCARVPEDFNVCVQSNSKKKKHCFVSQKSAKYVWLGLIHILCKILTLILNMLADANMLASPLLVQAFSSAPLGCVSRRAALSLLCKASQCFHFADQGNQFK